MLPKCPLQLGSVRCETTGSVDISTDLLERGQQSSEDNSNVAPHLPPLSALSSCHSGLPQLSVSKGLFKVKVIFLEKD